MTRVTHSCKKTTDQEVALSISQKHSSCSSPSNKKNSSPGTTLQKDNHYPDLWNNKYVFLVLVSYINIHLSLIFMNIMWFIHIVTCSKSLFILITIWYSIIWSHDHLSIIQLRNSWVFFRFWLVLLWAFLNISFCEYA